MSGFKSESNEHTQIRRILETRLFQIDQCGGNSGVGLEGQVFTVGMSTSVCLEASPIANVFLDAAKSTRFPPPILRRRVMPPDNKGTWLELYEAAIVETDVKEMESRIQAARAAIDSRFHDLQMDHGGSPEERHALDDALTGLKVLEREIKPTHPR